MSPTTKFFFFNFTGYSGHTHSTVCIGVQLIFDDKFCSVLQCIGKPKVAVGGGE